MDALIGYTGFVGSHLRRQHDFGALFNSANIGEAAGGRFGTLVCAAAPGSMFTANRCPERDEAAIRGLMDRLAPIRAGLCVLVSSIAVLAEFDGQDDEGTDRFQTGLAYGRHRRMLEEFCAERFDRCLIVRLPALFGRGLRKNFLFDLLNPMPTMLPRARLDELAGRLPAGLRPGLARFYRPDPETDLLVIDRAALAASGQRAAHDEAVTALGFSAVQFTHPATRFQYYDMDRLWSDIGLCLGAGLETIHLAPEPLEAGRIHAVLTGREMPAGPARVHREDMRTRHAALWGRAGPYIATADEVLAGLQAFFAGERALA
uniref:Uncharacterized protein n=1 Tax=Cereibacter sphaeroides (strain ATCC 17025 / ATH 2.4.3) TaxID=349102 RepID=A4WZT0_CERS5